MTGQTLLVFVSPATQGFMQSEETGGTEGRVIRMSDSRDSHYKTFLFLIFVVTVLMVILQRVGGESNLCEKSHRATVPPLRVYFLRI